MNKMKNKPSPQIKDWLLQSGFKESQNTSLYMQPIYVKNGVVIMKEYGKLYFAVQKFTGFGVEYLAFDGKVVLESVKQVQDLYFCLKGEKL